MSENSLEQMRAAMTQVMRGINVAKLGLARDGVQHAKLTQMEALIQSALDQPAPALPKDVRALVIAARQVAFADAPTPGDLQALDKASEAFADRVPWEDEP